MGKSKQKAENIVLWRDCKTMEHYIKLYKELGWTFKVKHSRYSTSIDLNGGNRIKMIVEQHDDKTFIANRMILRDLVANPYTEEICRELYSTVNYDSANGLPIGLYKDVINLDLSSAYATTLFISGLISQSTYGYLSSLPKRQRLVAVGMLAKKAIVYTYEDGECTDVSIEKGKYADIFFFLINKVNEAMKECKSIAADDYIFHWTDGLFVNYSIPKIKLRQIERYLSDCGYKYKYEKVEDFSVARYNDCLIMQMIKNDKPKKYMFYDRNFGQNFEEAIKAINEQDRIKLLGTQGVGRARPIQANHDDKTKRMALNKLAAIKREIETEADKQTNARPDIL